VVRSQIKTMGEKVITTEAKPIFYSIMIARIDIYKEGWSPPQVNTEWLAGTL